MDAIRPALAVVATLCVGAAGSGGDDSTAFPPFPEVGECVSGSEHPIRVEEALEVLRDHGFAMNARDTMCAEGEAARLSNVPPENDVWLSCIVLVEPRSERDVPVVIGAVDLERPDVEPVQREAGNVHCSLIADAAEDEPPERLDRAIADLERVAEG